jgi:pyridoxamine 5'-phosphate oxidase
MEETMDLSDVRREYMRQGLNKKSVGTDPLKQLEKWINEADEAGCPEHTTMTVATASADGQPSMRVVLLKYLKPEGLVFFTNYRSHKGKDLAVNSKIAAHFFWPELERQVKVEGMVHKADAETSDTYFKSRPFESKISSVMSHQSTEVVSRQELERMWCDEKKKWEGKEIERPDYWGGYLIKPTRVEFWQGREHRLHDRIVFIKHFHKWNVVRFSP